MSKKLIKIFDTTLRDGQQCPGAGMTKEKNLEYAVLSANSGTDIIELGFPSASEYDFDIVKNIVNKLIKLNKKIKLAALCQLRESQFKITIQALSEAIDSKQALLHTYIPVDPNLMNFSLGDYAKNKTKIIKDIYKYIKYAYDQGVEIEFSPEGYSNMGKNFDFVTDVIKSAICAGASVINCPDTIGGACKLQGENYFVENMKKHADLMDKEFDKKVIWSTHCHNDFGLALENSMEAVFNGPATQVEGCFNGIGERSGNVALEQVIMYIKHFGDLNQKFYTNFNLKNITKISDFVKENMLPRQPNWPITGDNCAKHSSGGHTNAILKNVMAYQPFDPKEIGNDISFVFGPLSGSNHAQNIINKNGYICEDKEKVKITQFIKNYYSTRRKGITDQELIFAYQIYRSPIVINEFNYKKKGENINLVLKGKFFENKDCFEIECKSKGSALIALNKAIDQFFKGTYIEDYQSKALTRSCESESETRIKISYNGSIYTGISKDKNIEISAFKALIEAVNKAYIDQHYVK